MRIASLLPSATEILFAIGAGDDVVGVTHECDYPPQARQCPALTSDLLPPGLSSAEIDAAVSTGIGDQHTIYALDAEALATAAPDVVVAQRLCDVCAVPVETVEQALCTMPDQACVVAADPHTLDDLGPAIIEIGAATGAVERAQRVVGDLRHRLDVVAAAVAGRTRPRVVVLEWPDPPWTPGHWVPDMVEQAGGDCVLGRSGAASQRTTFDALAAVEADIVITAFCGFDLAQTIERSREIDHRPEWAALIGGARLVAVDGSAYFSRPGPRLVDGVELLSWIFHGVGEQPPAARGAQYASDTWADVGSADAHRVAAVNAGR